jgi:S1-C subfamily serine protease
VSGERRRVSLGAIPDFAYPGPGLRLEGVVPGSPAGKAGMKPGDVLVQLSGKPVDDLSGFNALLMQHQPGDQVELRWIRAGTEAKATVELVPR